ncbi:MAG TPA: hypothetical protein DCY79_23910 [Planctomycetaceae bacterium]|nr:hypothetical protein [Blastopirellula sp.]HAY82866.1 hypothetical protein [Planctomycetaceae bacterium]
MTSTIMSGRSYAFSHLRTRDNALPTLDENLRKLGLSLTTANPGDHPAILSFLQSIHYQPTAAEFLAQTDHPLYEPTDRLLIRNRTQIVGHLQIARREMHFGGLRFPTACFCDMAIARPFRGKGLGTALLAEAERQATADSAVLATLWTKRPQEYSQHQWLPCGGQTHSIARTRDIMSSAHAAAQPQQTSITLPTDEVASELNIRLWRHVEEDALVRLREFRSAHSFGWTARSADYWRWLISRRGYDRIYVAIDGPAKLDLDESVTSIVGYAVMREGRILELVTSPERPDAGLQLLTRACGDAMERDVDPVRFEGPADEPLHSILLSAGGSMSDDASPEDSTALVKVFDPLAFLSQLAPLIHLRAKAAGVTLPSELGLLVDGEKHQLVVSRRSARLGRGKLGRSYLTCSKVGLSQLLLGGRPLSDLVSQDWIQPSTRIAEQLATALFPRLAFWLPPFDESPSLT